jgi:hypothetical protein
LLQLLLHRLDQNFKNKELGLVAQVYVPATREAEAGGFSFFNKVNYFIFSWDWGLNSELYACKAGALLLEAHLESILLWLFWRRGLVNYLPRLALNYDPPNLSLPSS